MATTKKTEDNKPDVPVPSKKPVFCKEQILVSSKYANYKDALSVVLSNDKTYTLDEVDRKLETFMKGKGK